MDLRPNQDVEVQLAALAGALRAAIEQGRGDRVEVLSGQASVLAWILGLGDGINPLGVDRPLAPTLAAVVDEYARAGTASLFEGPARQYAFGVYEALRWLLCQRAEPLVLAAA